MRIGDAIPEFALPDLDGEIHAVGEYADEILILNFWSCECPHVERTDALITKWLRERWQRDVNHVRIASNASESLPQLKEAAARKGIPLLLVDRQHAVADLFEALTTPHVFVFDGGRLRYRGAVDDMSFSRRTATRYYLMEAVDALLAGDEPPMSDTPSFGCAIVREALE